MKKLIALWVLSVMFYSPFVSAGESKSAQCPVGLVSGMTLDEEFGPGTQQATRCIKIREKVKVVFVLNKLCANTACTQGYGINNIENVIEDYEVTHGMSRSDYDIVVVVYGPGYPLVLNNQSPTPHATTNPFQAKIQGLLDKGIKIQFCQNTARAQTVKFNQLMPGITFVTGGITAAADYQALGYSVILP